MTKTNRLNLSYIAPAQAQKHITVNEAFRQIDRLSQISVIARDVNAQPSEPQSGKAYILPPNATGESWSNAPENSLAFYDDGWHFSEPREGFQVWVEAEQTTLVFSDGNWITLPLTTTDQMGINTSPDNINRLSVKSDAELLTHDDITPGSGDARKLINKKSVTHTASVLFQNNYAGRAEVGLIGEDDFAIKTSIDGSTFNTAMRISPVDDEVDFFHTLKVNQSEVLSNADKPAFVANIASATTSYSDNSVIDLSASLDTHNGFDALKNAFIIPVSGLYFVQVGIVIRSVSSGVTIVKLRAFKNGTLGQSVSAVTADANITTVNDSSLLEFQAGDEVSLKTTFNDTTGSVQFFPSSRLVMHRVI